MSIILPFDITVDEMRVLQEYRRIATESMALEAIAAIRHPTGPGGEAAAEGLALKGYLRKEPGAYVLTARGQAFLVIDAKPAIPGA
ncbi:MAG: hypothetical protein ABI024_04190 [Vicinamibacterales bacterium]